MPVLDKDISVNMEKHRFVPVQGLDSQLLFVTCCCINVQKRHVTIHRLIAVSSCYYITPPDIYSTLRAIKSLMTVAWQ